MKWFFIGWFGGASAMWFYLRFSKLIRNRTEHTKALAEEVYRIEESHGLLNAIYTRDFTRFRKFLKEYFKKPREEVK